MGKSKAKKKAPRPNPVGLTAEHIILDEEDLVGESSDVLERIHGEITSGSSNDKECGCAKLSLIADKKFKEILELKMVKMAAPLILDKNDSVRHSAIGALKNLSLVSEDVCEEMVTQDVMTPLCKLLANYNQDWQPAKSEGKIDTNCEVFVEAITLLSNLCEASSTALKIFNQSSLVQLLLMHVNTQLFGNAVVATVLQCLNSVSETNPPAIEAIREKEALFTQLLASSVNAVDPSDLYIKVLACGVAVNVSAGSPSALPVIMTTLASVLTQDQRKMICDLSSLIPIRGVVNGRGKAKSAENGHSSEDLENQICTLEQSVKDVILGQQIALEILTNLCCDDANEEDEEWEDTDMNSDMSDDNISLNGSETPAIDAGYTPKVLVDVTEAVVGSNVVSLVLQKANLPAENVMEILRSHQPSTQIVKLLSTLRIRAFLCLNNLVGILSLDDLGGSGSLFDIWSNLGLLCFKDNEQNHASEELCESATSAMRAVTHKLLDSKCYAHFSELSAPDFERMVQFGAESQHGNVRINMIQIIGCIGVAAALAGGDLSGMLANFLVEAAAKDSDLRVVAEALDKIFDMFAEDVTDQLCVDINLVPKLKQMIPGLKVKIGMSKKRSKSGEVVAVINMAKANLLRFIKYKEKRPIVAASSKR